LALERVLRGVKPIKRERPNQPNGSIESCSSGSEKLRGRTTPHLSAPAKIGRDAVPKFIGEPIKSTEKGEMSQKKTTKKEGQNEVKSKSLIDRGLCWEIGSGGEIEAKRGSQQT